MLDWFQYHLPSTKIESSSFGMYGLEGRLFLAPCLPLTSRFFPSTNPAATDEVVIWYGVRDQSF